MCNFCGTRAESTAKALTPIKATTRIATMTIHMRRFPPTAWAGGAAGSAKIPPPSTPDASSRWSSEAARTGRAYLMVIPQACEIVEPWPNHTPFGQSLDQRLNARRGEVSFVAQKFLHSFGIEGPGDDLFRRHDGRMQKEFVNRIDVVRERPADFGRNRRKRVMLPE